MDIMPPETEPERCCRNSWSDLPDDLLSVILDRLPPALGDRVRFRGVCQAWRAAELAHPRPPMPWLVVPGHCVSLHDAAIHRVVLPEDACAAACRGSFGDWLALVPPDSGRPYMLNAFTMARIKLPRWAGEPMGKIVSSSAPDTESGCTVAAIVHHCSEYRHKDKGEIVVCRLGGGGAESTWWSITDVFSLQDIIFFEGKLHALDGFGRVHQLFEDADLERLQNKGTWKPPVEEIRGRFDDARLHLHLVALHGRLCMVGRRFGAACVPGGSHYTCAVGVFELPTTAIRPPPVKDFNGHAVFVGDACCGAFAAGGKMRENQICFVDGEKNLSSLSLTKSGQRDARRPLRALQSYDPKHRCVRTYQPCQLTQPWQCVAAQRFPNKRTMGPPPLTTPSTGPELLLWDVLSCLGSSAPLYSTAPADHLGTAVTVRISVAKSRAYHSHTWRFKKRRQSASEAKQAAAHEAVTFLRSRFRAVLDESPWSSIPYLHGAGVDLKAEQQEEEEEEEEEQVQQINRDNLFRYRDIWYRR